MYRSLVPPIKNGLKGFFNDGGEFIRTVQERYSLSLKKVLVVLICTIFRPRASDVIARKRMTLCVECSEYNCNTGYIVKLI